MISVCTVIEEAMQDFVDVFIHSVVTKCKHVKEVIVVHVNTDQEDLYDSFNIDGIQFNFYGHLVGRDWPVDSSWVSMVAGHALGLHYAIEKTTQDYIWFSDPDIFFFEAVDDFYLDLIDRYQLDMVGICHFNPTNQCYGNFPCITNMLVHRDKLPTADWLQGQLKLRSGMLLTEKPFSILDLDGRYLIPSPIPEQIDRFPNRDGYFDAGCNLWLWSLDQNWRWIGFHLDDNLLGKDRYSFVEMVYPMNYNKKNYHSSFGLQDDLGDEDLLFHRTTSYGACGIEFKNLYRRIFDVQESSSRSESAISEVVFPTKATTQT